MAYELEIEKLYWGRYYIIRAKLHQHKQYKMAGTDKHKIGKYERGKDRTDE